MLPKVHIITGAIFALLIWIIFPSVGWLNALIIFLSSFLIDVDHYLYYLYKQKDHSLKKAYRWFIEKKERWFRLSKKQREKETSTIIIFHGIEFFIVLVLLIFLNKIFFFVLLGISLHMILDFIELKIYNVPLYYKISQLYILKLNKHKHKELE